MSTKYTAADIAVRDQDFAAINAAINGLLASWKPPVDPGEAGEQAAALVVEAAARWLDDSRIPRNHRTLATACSAFAGALMAREAS